MNITEERIKKMAQAGATLSRHFSRPFSKEWEAPTMRIERYTGVERDLVALWRCTMLHEPMLFDICGCGDLEGVIYPNGVRFPDMHQWTAARWEYEIRKRVQ